MNQIWRTLLLGSLLSGAMVLFAQEADSPFSGVKEELKPKTGVIKIGDDRWTRRGCEITAVPEELKGAHSLIIARGSDKKPGVSYEFTVNKAGTVYLIVNPKGKAQTCEGWTKTDLIVKWKVKDFKFDDLVYSKTVAAGEKVVVPSHTGKKKLSYGAPHMVLMK